MGSAGGFSEPDPGFSQPPPDSGVSGEEVSASPLMFFYFFRFVLFPVVGRSKRYETHPRVKQFVRC